MRITLLFALFLASVGCSTGGGPQTVEGAFAVALDGANNHFGTVVLDDGSTVFGGDAHDQVAFGQVGGPDVVETFPSDGGFFLVCYDDAGALLWTQPLPDSVELAGIARAPDGTFGVLCEIFESATIDGQTVDVGIENEGVIVLRYTGAGGALLSIQVIAAGGVDAVRFAYAPDGSLFVALRIQQRTTIDPQGPGDSLTVQPGSDRVGAIVRYDPTGARAWVSQSSSGSVWFPALAVTDAGDCVGVITLGGEGSILDSDQDGPVEGIRVGGEDSAIFLLRAADGNVGWTDFFGGLIDADHVRTAGGSIVLTGSISETVTFGRSTAVVATEPRAGFVALYDTLEQFEWVRTITDPVANVGVRCACIRDGTFVVTGNGGLATSFEDGPQGVDAPTFVAAYRFSSFEWLLTLRADGITFIDECELLPDGMMLIKGSHESAVTFPGGTRVPAPAAGEGSFVARIALPD